MTGGPLTEGRKIQLKTTKPRRIAASGLLLFTAGFPAVTGYLAASLSASLASP